ISPKSISLKLLCPLLDNASLEEDDFLQDKWAILLSNLVDSESNIQNHVFPYILGQISKTEFMIIEKAYWEKVDREKKMKAEIVECKLEEESKSTLLGKELKELREKRDLYRSANEQYFHRIRRQRELEEELRKIPEKLITLEYNLKKPQSIPEDGIREFEVSNLIRLGLIRLIQEPFADGQTLEIPNKPEQPYLLVDLDIDLGSNDEHVLTELGLLFIEACSEKKCRNQ
ncbi:hypothetical protein, partial [Chitinophaga sp.]|uniref:Abi-alpha family protein n=1 Tax=Chitinophaga sp. TaxID=1869181 RepID=UPI002F943ED5